MATYEYESEGEVFEVQQSMKETAFTHRTEGFTHLGRDIPGRWLRLDPEFVGQLCIIEDDDGEGHSAGRETAYPVKRLISASSGGFRLVSGPSGGWASTGYSKNEGHRQAEAILGRPLNKPL